MADQLPHLAPTPGGRWPRSWHEYANYRVVHENATEALVREGLVVSDTTEFREAVDPGGRLLQVNVRGRVLTSGGAVVIVNKWLDVQTDDFNRAAVLTSEYDYHAYRVAPPRRDLFRYDSCHGLPDLHVHRFHTDGIEVERPSPIALERMPPLNEIIREADALARWLTEYERAAT